VIAETKHDMIKTLNEWNNNVESRGMRVNVNKTKCKTSEGEAEGCKWPSGVCGIDVCYNAIQCSVIKGTTSKVMKSFICRCCLNPVTSAGRTSLYIGASAKLELVDKFCYLDDMLSVDGDADAAVEARI